MVYYQGKNAVKTRVPAAGGTSAILVGLKRTSMAENRVVIKINYDKDKHRKELIDPKMVTVWHTKRILVAAVILLLLIILIFSWFSVDETSRQNQSAPEVSPNPAEAIPQSVTTERSAIKPLSGGQDTQATQGSRPPAIILDKRVVRASINSVIKNNEPGEPIKSPVTIEPNQTLELFYFSEIKNMKDKVLFHHWFKNGQAVYKKQLDIKANKSKLISSRKLTAKDSGDWQVVLIDKKGKLFSEVNFSVNP